MSEKEKNRKKKNKKILIIVIVLLVIAAGGFFSYKFFLSNNQKDEYSYESLKKQGLIPDIITEERFEIMKDQFGDDPEQLITMLENISDNIAETFSGQTMRGMMNPFSSRASSTGDDVELEEIYLVYPVTQGVNSEYISITGTLEAETRDVISKISADILEIFVEEGDFVTENSTIATLDDIDYMIDYLTAYNNYENSWDLSENERKLQELKLLKAENDLEYTIIKSPINGIVSSVNVNEGEKISNESAAVEIVDYENVYISGIIDEIDIGKIYEGMTAQVIFLNYDIEMTGEVSFISPVAETSGGVVVVSIEIDLDENPYEKGIIAGVSCDVNLLIQDFAGGNVVPSNTVYEDENGKYVLKQTEKDSESTEKVYVEVGEETEDNVQILSGIQIGDTLVIQPDIQETLRLNDSNNNDMIMPMGVGQNRPSGGNFGGASK